MSLSLSALLNPDSSEEQEAGNIPPEQGDRERQVSPSPRREGLQSTTLPHSPELHAQLPKYTPPQRPKTNDSTSILTSSAIADIRQGDRTEDAPAPTQRASSDATNGSIDVPASNVGTTRKMSLPAMEQDQPASRSPELRKASLSMQTSGVVLPTLQMPIVGETIVPKEEGDIRKGDIHKPANLELMDQVDIKEEAVASPQDTIPADIRRASIANSDADVQMSKTLASLKHEHNSRTHSPLRESSLALPSTEDASPSTATMKKRPAPSRKKGTATTAKKNKVTKKRKADVKASLKNGNTRASSAASPTPSDRAGEEYDEDESMAGSDEDVEGSGDVYCICRKPDNGTFMIGCDGGCDDWYHGKCVNVEERNKGLIDKYICPRCVKAGIGQTSWKRMCRRQGCRLPARVGKNAGKNGATSKYCSDECGVLFFRQMTALARGDHTRKARRKSGVEDLDDRAGAKGGLLSPGEVRAMLDQTNTAGELRDLGNGVLSPPATPSGTPDGAEDMTGSEKDALHKIAVQKGQARERHQMLKDRLKFATMVKDAATRTAVEKDLKPKEYCGCDSRLEWSEEEFTSWRQSPPGQRAFETDGLEGEAGDHEVCSRKKCARHTDWNKLAVDDIRFETTENSDRMRTLEHEERDIRERAATRAKARKFGIEEGKVEMHDVIGLEVGNVQSALDPEVSRTMLVDDSEAMDVDTI